MQCLLTNHFPLLNCFGELFVEPLLLLYFRTDSDDFSSRIQVCPMIFSFSTWLSELSESPPLGALWRHPEISTPLYALACARSSHIIVAAKIILCQPLSFDSACRLCFPMLFGRHRWPKANIVPGHICRSNNIFRLTGCVPIALHHRGHGLPYFSWIHHFPCC